MTELPKEGAPEGSRDTGSASAEESWGPALLRAAAVLVLSWAGFLFIPDRLLAYLTTRVTPHSRDALVSAWVAIWFLALSGVFVALQPRKDT